MYIIYGISRRTQLYQKYMQDKITIYTDGSCLGNPGPGGWSAIIMHKGGEQILNGGEPETTNNRMEMAAIVNALKWLNQNVSNKNTTIELFSDSSLLINSITKGWKRKANLDIWGKFDEQKGSLYNKGLFVNWNWVKGHHTNKYNARADELAVKESMKQRKILRGA